MSGCCRERSELLEPGEPDRFASVSNLSFLVRHQSLRRVQRSLLHGYLHGSVALGGAPASLPSSLRGRRPHPPRSNFTESGSSIVIPAGSTQGSITLTGIDDHLYDPNTAATVSISGVSNATLGTPTLVSAIVRNSDPEPTVSLSIATPTFADPNGTDKVTATLNTVSGEDTTITLSFGGTAFYGANYTASGHHGGTDAFMLYGFSAQPASFVARRH